MSASTMTPQQFVAKWRGITLTERAAAQSHFNDLCHMLGHETPTDLDPTGAFFTFERGVEKLDGGNGFADVWYKGHFAWEYKKRRKNLTEAYKQLLLYRDNLENPPLLVVCDTDVFEVRTNFTNTPTQLYRWTNEELVNPANLAVLRALFYNPEALRPSKTLAQVTEEAAQEFAQLAPRLTSRGLEAHHVAHFLIRCLFCLFAEDIGLLPEDMFTRVVTNSLSQPETFEARIRGLFSAMAVGGMFGADNLPFFNGGLFNSERFGATDAIALTITELRMLYDATKHDWSNIEPAIFGTLFERSLDPTKRSQLGAHYTGKDDILRIVEPVLMAPLRARWREVREQMDDLVQRRDEARSRYLGRSDGAATKARADADKAVENALLGFLVNDLGTVTVLDPACGSGNFLYVALEKLLDLQNEVRAYAADNRITMPLPVVNPQQLYGFEVNTYAAELAQVVIWIGYLQWMLAHYGSYDDRPILKAMDSIAQHDAVLDLSDPTIAREPEWPRVYAIIGNPPFLGGKRMRSELGDGYVDALFRVYDHRVPREADFVCYWFERAREQLAAGKVKRVGLLATNSIRGGANREVLEHIKQSGDIFMAWSDEPWTLEGAAVRISLVGFDRGDETARVLDGKPVAAIHADLTSGVDLTKARRLRENVGIAFMGDTKGGPFDILPDVAQRMLAAPLNPNGRPNADVVRPWVNGLDITRRPRGMSIIDFGVDMPMHEAALYEQPFTWVEQQVKPDREKNRRVAYKERWWLHMEPRPAMRAALAPLHRFMCTPRVARHRLFVWLDSDTLPDSATIAIARDDDFTFGVLHSHLHELWALRMGTSLEDRPRYTPRTTFETFPFPHPTDAQREAIAEAARDLDAKRLAWLNPPDARADDLKRRTLTNLYNERPAWLRMAHERLDAAVFAAYGWEPSLTDEEVLSRLLALNLERAATSEGAVDSDEDLLNDMEDMASEG